VIATMKRREFITLLGAVVWPLAARAQQPATNGPRIGFLALPNVGVEEIRQALRELGYIEGQNIAFEIFSMESGPDRLPDLAAELMRRKVAVIVTYGPQSTQAAQHATRKIPIVMARMDDADAQGFVTNYSRPGGNITGLSFQTGELSTKWIELLKESLPSGARIAALWDATGTGNQLRTIEQAAQSVKVDLHTVEWRSPEEFAVAFGAMQKAGVKGVVILASPLFSAQMIRLSELAAAHRIAATYIYRAFVEAGGLISYGPLDSDPSFNRRRAAYFVDKLLKGAKVADLPVEQPTRFYLAINLKTAKALGLEIPPTLLARADEVIE
jgi:putative tryptophan/tyrosine transport system substrate-binding protein